MYFLLLLLFQNADQVILEFSKKCTELDTSMTVFHNELSLLPEVIKNIETAKADIGQSSHSSDQHLILDTNNNAEGDENIKDVIIITKDGLSICEEIKFSLSHTEKIFFNHVENIQVDIC